MKLLNTSMKDLVNKFRDVPRFDHLLKIRPDLAP